MASRPHQPDVMSLGDHLDELRKRLLLALLPPVPLMIALFFVSEWLLRLLLGPVYEAMAAGGVDPALQVLSPPEMIIVRIKVSVIGALICAAPWVFYQAWLFVAPGLYKHERRFVHLLVPGSAVLTVAGVLLLYFVMLPLTMRVLVLFSADFQMDMGPRLDAEVRAIVVEATEAGALELVAEPPADPAHGDIWLLIPEMELFVALAEDLEAYEAGTSDTILIEPVPPARRGVIKQPYRLSFAVNFVLLLLAAMVIAFQLPLAMLLLGWMDLLRPEWLAQQRRYAVFGCAIVSAMITPQDIMSMIVMVIPLYGLFELGLLLMRFLPAGRVAQGFGRSEMPSDPKPPSDDADGTGDRGPDGPPPEAPNGPSTSNDASTTAASASESDVPEPSRRALLPVGAPEPVDDPEIPGPDDPRGLFDTEPATEGVADPGDSGKGETGDRPGWPRPADGTVARGGPEAEPTDDANEVPPRERGREGDA